MASDRAESSRDAIHATDGYKRQIEALRRLVAKWEEQERTALLMQKAEVFSECAEGLSEVIGPAGPHDFPMAGYKWVQEGCDIIEQDWEQICCGRPGPECCGDPGVRDISTVIGTMKTPQWAARVVELQDCVPVAEARFQQLNAYIDELRDALLAENPLAHKALWERRP